MVREATVHGGWYNALSFAVDGQDMGGAPIDYRAYGNGRKQ